MRYRRLWALMASVMVVVFFLVLTEWKTQTEIKPTLTFVAKADIPPHTRITEDMLQQIELPERGLPPMVLHQKKDIVGQWTQVNFGIPKNGFFFKDKVVSEQQLLDAERMKLKDGQQLLTLDVDIERSAAGNVIPDSLVDVWWVSKSAKQNKTVSGRLFSNLLVVGAKNKRAEDVIEKNTTTPSTSDKNNGANKNTNSTNKDLFPTIVQLAVSAQQMQLIRAAEQFGKVYLVPQGGPLVQTSLEVPTESNQNIDDPVNVRDILLQHLDTGNKKGDSEHE